MKTTSITSSPIYSAQRRTRTISRTHQHGLTLIEVMISVTISLILLAGVMQIFTSSRQTYKVQDSMGRLQENGRFALSFLTRDVRMADYWGCMNNSANLVNNLNPAGVGFIAFGNGIVGTNTGGGVGLQDSITLSMGVPSGLTIQAPFMGNNNAAPIQVSLPNTLAPGQIVSISNCTNGDIFQISAGNPSVSGIVPHVIGGAAPGNCSPLPPLPPPCSGNLSASYGANAELMTAQTITYSIANDIANDNEPTLFQSVNGGAAVALVEGVENMQILYGEDTDPRPVTTPPTPLTPENFSANRYVPAGTVGLNMRRVVSVRIGLVLRTKENNLATAVQTYNFNGAVVTPADRRLRRVFSTTIGLRNRGA